MRGGQECAGTLAFLGLAYRCCQGAGEINGTGTMRALGMKLFGTLHHLPGPLLRLPG
jgi:hypothetical protein